VCEGATCMFVDGYGSWPSRKPACVNVSVCVCVRVCVRVRVCEVVTCMYVDVYVHACPCVYNCANKQSSMHVRDVSWQGI